MRKLLVNIDCGELDESGQAFFKLDDILPLVDLANISCGMHAGTFQYINQTVRACIEYKVAIGLHPSYPDRINFGRRQLDIPHRMLIKSLQYQVASLSSLIHKHGGTVHHLKPHGALYNAAFDQVEVAQAILQATSILDKKPIIIAAPQSQLLRLAEDMGFTVWKESFADRAYNQNASLCPRNQGGAIHGNLPMISRQILALIEGKVTTLNGTIIELESETICFHGDHPLVLQSLTFIKSLNLE